MSWLRPSGVKGCSITDRQIVMPPNQSHLLGELGLLRRSTAWRFCWCWKFVVIFVSLLANEDEVEDSQVTSRSRVDDKAVASFFIILSIHCPARRFSSVARFSFFSMSAIEQSCLSSLRSSKNALSSSGIFCFHCFGMRNVKHVFEAVSEDAFLHFFCLCLL